MATAKKDLANKGENLINSCTISDLSLAKQSGQMLAVTAQPILLMDWLAVTFHRTHEAQGGTLLPCASISRAHRIHLLL
uniref:Uncharacterized protein n=1 Tax=Oryza meyeriana var. granulata TaxID=110450 RepID=A0A1V1H290_9ORYZ|nr:hypothetical protein [Oryza meyeriana var. granulata]